MSKRYPEHEKLKAVADKTQFVHDFLTFCEEKGISLQTEKGVYMRHADLLYEFAEIDQWKLEAEKREMLDGLQGDSSAQVPKKQGTKKA